MCVICGCNDNSAVRVEGEVHAHSHTVSNSQGHTHVMADGRVVQHNHHDHDHGDHNHGHGQALDHNHSLPHGAEHDHTHSHAAFRKDAPGELVALEKSLLDKNARIAERNRGWFAGRNILALNLMSSPGAGKTTLLVRTLKDLSGEVVMSVIEGDQETSADADRIRATGAKAIQINTGAGCHLEADMVEAAVQRLAPPKGSVLFVENVGNLVCPALFDLGEKARVVVLSVTEGDDKPLKYPHMFRSAQLMVTTKMDLAPYVEFDVAQAERHARSVNPGIQCLRVSSTTGSGMESWYEWIRAMLRSGAAL